MRVFCPEHSKGFFAPRQSPIKCENRGHVLGELDFEGASQPSEITWQYCCNCEHFCPFAANQEAPLRCPVCARPSSLRYVCHRCFTLSFESRSPTLTKNFTLTAEGAPKPSCPACLQAAPADLREHSCDELGAMFITALNSCPICRERLDIAPVFPSSVAEYLKRTRAANKMNVTFDYESGLFVRVEDGEYVLIANGSDNLPIILPRFSRFAGKRHFYDFYQDYYYCANPDAGEVQIIQPATVDRVEGGWKPKTPGVLEVVGQKEQRSVPVGQARNSTVPKPKSAGKAKEMAQPLPPGAKVVTCRHCNSAIETKYAFCWNCGKAINANQESSGSPPPRKMMPSEADETLDEAFDPPRGPGRGPAMFAWASPEDPDQTGSGGRTALKLIALLLVGVLLATLGVFVLLPWLQRPATAAGETAKQQAPGVATTTDQRAASRPVANSEEDALNRIRQLQRAGGPLENSAVDKELAAGEKKYPNDYRFSYERARLSIKSGDSQALHEASNALALAAKKAIRNGKADEMLRSLDAEKGGDLYKLSESQGELRQLKMALKRDENSLTGSTSTKTHH